LKLPCIEEELSFEEINAAWTPTPSALDNSERLWNSPPYIASDWKLKASQFCDWVGVRYRYCVACSSPLCLPHSFALCIGDVIWALPWCCFPLEVTLCGQIQISRGVRLPNHLLSFTLNYLPPRNVSIIFPGLWFWKLSQCSYFPFHFTHLQQQCAPLHRVAQKSVDTRCLIFCPYYQVNFAPFCTSRILTVTAREGELAWWDISIRDLNLTGYWCKIYLYDDVRLRVDDVDIEFFYVEFGKFGT
jgi:hypothetical protein